MPRARIRDVLRRYADRTTWPVALGFFALTFGVREDSWSAGVVSGLGAVALLYGCACYAKAKGHHAGVGALLGAVWVLGIVLFQRFEMSRMLASALYGAALLGLVLLRDRHKTAARTPSAA
jgi:hypothetical protein